MLEQKKYKIALIVGGWYFPEHLYKTINELIIPKNVILDKFVVSHRLPSNEIKTDIEKLQLNTTANNAELICLDNQLYSNIADINALELNFTHL